MRPRTNPGAPGRPDACPLCDALAGPDIGEIAFTPEELWVAGFALAAMASTECARLPVCEAHLATIGCALELAGIAPEDFLYLNNIFKRGLT